MFRLSKLNDFLSQRIPFFDQSSKCSRPVVLSVFLEQLWKVFDFACIAHLRFG
jgi:hypothetical protein